MKYKKPILIAIILFVIGFLFYVYILIDGFSKSISPYINYKNKIFDSLATYEIYDSNLVIENISKLSKLGYIEYVILDNENWHIDTNLTNKLINEFKIIPIYNSENSLNVIKFRKFLNDSIANKKGINLDSIYKSKL